MDQWVTTDQAEVIKSVKRSIFDMQAEIPDVYIHDAKVVFFEFYHKPKTAEVRSIRGKSPPKKSTFLPILKSRLFAGKDFSKKSGF